MRIDYKNRLNCVCVIPDTLDDQCCLTGIYVVIAINFVICVFNKRFEAVGHVYIGRRTNRVCGVSSIGDHGNFNAFEFFLPLNSSAHEIAAISSVNMNTSPKWSEWNEMNCDLNTDFPFYRKFCADLVFFSLFQVGVFALRILCIYFI